MAIWNSLIGVGSSFLNGVFDIFNTNRQNKTNMSNWYKMQEYNSPLNQMNRLKSAGLNPNLVYGQSSGNVAGNTSPAPQVSKYEGQLINSRAAYELQMMSEQIKNARAQNKLIHSVAEKNVAETNGINYRNTEFLPLQKLSLELQNVGKQISNEQAGSMASWLHDTYKARVEREFNTSNFQSLSIKEKRFVVDNLLPIRQTAAKLGLDLKQSQIDMIKSNILLNSSKIENLSVMTDQQELNYIIDEQLKADLQKLGAAGKIVQIFVQLLNSFK